MLDGIWKESMVNATAYRALPEYYGRFERVEPQHHYPGVHFGLGRVYVVNSEPNILRQLRRCLQHYYARVRLPTVFGGPHINLFHNRADDP